MVLHLNMQSTEDAVWSVLNLWPYHHAKFQNCITKCTILTRSSQANSNKMSINTHIHAHLTALFPDYQVSWYQEGKTDLDFTEARDSEWQWHQLGRIHCTSLHLAP